jgi:hypothetical protein
MISKLTSIFLALVFGIFSSGLPLYVHLCKSHNHQIVSLTQVKNCCNNAEDNSSHSNSCCNRTLNTSNSGCCTQNSENENDLSKVNESSCCENHIIIYQISEPFQPGNNYSEYNQLFANQIVYLLFEISSQITDSFRNLLKPSPPLLSHKVTTIIRNCSFLI